MAPRLPTVSALVAVYNYEQYVAQAIESALTQEYPPELLDVVVVDDGSTDGTADVVNEFVHRFPNRVRLIQQANGGAACAADRAIAEAKGDLLAFLDADDVWLPDKTRRQVTMLESRPELGLVFSEMIVVDAVGAVVRRSHMGPLGRLPPRMVAQILNANVATSSSIMVRAALRDVFAPIPRGIAYADWWVTLRVAEVSQIDYVREPLALYRLHGANFFHGVSGADLAYQLRLSVDFQLLALRRVALDTLTPEELLYVWSGVEDYARQVLALSDSHLVAVHGVDTVADAEVRALLAEADRARARGDSHSEAAFALRALAADPSRIGAHARFIESVERARPPAFSGLGAAYRRILRRLSAPIQLVASVVAVIRWQYRRTRQAGRAAGATHHVRRGGERG
jgi:glycosyltransferase involved in cell wall biosynthesis